MSGSARALRSPFSKLHEQEVFAVEAERVQLCIRANSPEVTVDVAGQRVTATTKLGVAVVAVEGLHPNTTYTASLETVDGNQFGQLSFTTRPPLLGSTRKFATISDVHLGATEFGGQPSITEPEGTYPPFALRCAKAAVDEAIAWGAEVLVIKGDLTDTGANDDWELAHDLLDDLTIPVMATWGNHDVWKTREVDPSDVEGTFTFDSSPVTSADLGPLRIVLADTSIPNRGHGDLARHSDRMLAECDTGGPVFLGIHHNIMRTPLPWFWPAGIPSTNARPVLSELAKVNPNTFISAGHTHRNRRHGLGPDGGLTFTEVSATADYPGAWAGYEVSADIIRQTVKRTAAPEAVGWSERHRSALKGVWARWAQGRLDDRCVDMPIS